MLTVNTCIPEMLKPHQPANVPVAVEGFYWKVPWLSVRSPPACPLCLVFRRTVTALIWLHLPYIFPLCRLMSSDGVYAFVLRSVFLSLMQTPFQLLFFLFLSIESCFCCLPSLRVRDRHTSCIVYVGLRVCVSGHVCLCVYVCVSTSVE